MDKKLSKTISYFMRHNPWEIELELDDAGWAPIDQLIDGLRPDFPAVKVSDIEQVIANSDKTRFEIKGDKIRATYGHSLPKKIKKVAEEPPTFLYHGTAAKTVDLITKSGLLPMKRQYCHLAMEPSSAKLIGKRKSKNVVVIVVEAKRAWGEGIKFYKELRGIWLADQVPHQYLQPIL